MMEIVAIESDKVESIWPQVRDHINAALDYTKGEISESLVKEKLIKGENLLLVVFDKEIIASIVCEIIQTCGVKVCHILACGGTKADTWLDKWYDLIVPLAKEQGCSRISISGRVGWIKKLGKYGFKHAYTTIDQDI